MSSNVTFPNLSRGEQYIAAARAEHDKHCDRCRALTEESDARAAANGESIRRRDRKTLGLILDMHTKAVAL